MNFQVRKWINRAEGTYYDHGTFGTVGEANTKRGDMVVQANAEWRPAGNIQVVPVDADGNIIRAGDTT